MNKEVTKENISPEAVRALDFAKVMAIAFAEVGAQGMPNYIEVFSDLPDKVSVLSGNFGFEAYGTRRVEAVDIEDLERVVPFLKWFRGTSRETTQRGNFYLDNEWVHLDAIFGNHFFIRCRLLDEFMSRLEGRQICEAGLDVITDMLSAGAGAPAKALNGIIGAIVGDIAGSRFEWHNRKSKQFTFLKGRDESRYPCHFTDDSVMTLAVADAILKWRENGGGSYETLSAEAVKSMQAFGRLYPHAGYGGSFRRWLAAENPQPYNSWGNGAAMRVSACGWAAWTLDVVKGMSRAVTEVTHNHPEGIKGAEATTVAVFLARRHRARLLSARLHARRDSPAIQVRCLLPRLRAAGARGVLRVDILRGRDPQRSLHRRRLGHHRRDHGRGGGRFLRCARRHPREGRDVPRRASSEDTARFRGQFP